MLSPKFSRREPGGIGHTANLEPAPKQDRRVEIPAAETFVEFPDEAHRRNVAERFAEMAARHGHRPAVRGETTVLTYNQLASRAQTVCAAVQQFFAHGDRPVAMLLPNDVELIVAMLGSVMLGRPYVVLDPALPPERLRHFIADSGAGILIYGPQREKLARQLAMGDLELLNLSDALQCPASPSRVDLRPETPLCLNYTSGTTGTPSGVVRTHRALLANIRNMTNLAKLSCEDRLIMCVSSASGAAAMDIFGALLNGGCVLPFDLRAKGAALLGEWLAIHQATIFHAVPTLFRSLVRVLEHGLELPKIRLVLLGGEAVFRTDFEAFRRHFRPETYFQNVLGITEGAGIVCSYMANHASQLDSECVPVGYAVTGKHIRIVDDSGLDLPRGTVGEIIVESADLSLGYHGQSKKTKERFKALASNGHCRFHTGDLGRFRPEDGALECLGRKDSQLKIGGLRVSPLEIESALLQEPSVREAAVTFALEPSKPNPAKGPVLLAWVVLNSGFELNPESLRQFLRLLLPAEAIPARFFPLERLPVLPGGKVERSALNLDHPAAKTDAILIPPRNAVEQAVANAWNRVLERRCASVRENFFESGGDSLAAVNLLSLLSSHFGFELPGHALLRHPTVAELAEMIPVWRTQRGPHVLRSTVDRPDRSSTLIPLQTRGAAPPLFLLPGGQGREAELLVFGEVIARLAVKRPTWGFRISDLNGQFSELCDLAEIATLLNRVLLSNPPFGAWTLAGECGAGLIAVEMARQLRQQSPSLAPRNVILLDTHATAYLTGQEGGIETNLIPDQAAQYYKHLFTWKPRPFDFPLWLICSEEVQSRNTDPTLGWGSYTRAAINIERIPGSHSSYLRQHARLVAKAMNRIMGST